MKKTLVYLLSGLALVAALINLTSFTTDVKENQNASDYILVEIYEVPSYEMSGVHIHFSDGKTEYIPFDKEMATHHHDDIGQIIVNSVNKLVAKGYVIEHANSGLADSGMITKLWMRKN
jgi:hypothetical protein